MNNKYRIDINWNPNGPRFISAVIIDLINELNESLKVPIMEESKREEEVRKILDNPEGVTIKELQIIDVRNLTKELRIEVRNKLEWSYRYLSRNTVRLIGERNDLPDREKSFEKTKEIDDKNEELKNTIISQYGAIEKLVKNYKDSEKLDENKRKLLTYIRKVYCPALSDIIEKFFSTAASGTKRAEIFPPVKQKEVFAKIDNLKKEIWNLTKKSKQNQSNQQIQELQQQISRLQDKVPDDLPNDWKKQLADKKQLEIKLNAAQTDLSNEQQARQQAENKIRQAEQFGLKDWDNLAKQTGGETLASLLDRPKKGELEKVERERNQRPNITVEKYTQSQKQNIEKLKKLIKGVDDKTSQGGLDRVETRTCLKEIRDGLEKTVAELREGVNTEYQNLQVQPSK